MKQKLIRFFFAGRSFVPDPTYILIGFLPIFFIIKYHNSIMWGRWFVLLFGLGLLWAVQFGKIFGKLAGIAMGYTIGHTIIYGINRDGPYAGIDPKVFAFIQSRLYEPLITILLMTGFFLCLDALHWRELKKVWTAILGISVFGIIVDYFMGYPPGGTIGNPSLAGCFVSALFLVWGFEPAPDNRYSRLTFKNSLIFLIFAASPVAIVLTGGSVPLASFGVGFTVYVLCTLNKKSFPKFTLPYLIILAVMLGAGFIFQDDNLFDDRGRIGMWRLIWDYWNLKIDKLYGSGLGTIRFYAPMIQKTNSYDPDYTHLWIHSDWFELLFEQGIVGLTLWGLVVLNAFRTAILNGRYYAAAALTSFSFSMLLNPMVHWPFNSLLGCYIFVHCFIDSKRPRR